MRRFTRIVRRELGCACGTLANLENIFGGRFGARVLTFANAGQATGTEVDRSLITAHRNCSGQVRFAHEYGAAQALTGQLAGLDFH